MVRQRRFWIFVAVLACEFVLFETGLRLRAGSEAAPAFQRLFMTDSRVGFRLRPGAKTRFTTSEFETDISINSTGVRDDEIGPKAPNERRIVVLGDSLVMAVQVPLEQTFCKRLENRLNQDPAAGPYRYRVINAGIQGYGPIEDWLFYTEVASAFDADIVLVALYIGNDAIEAADSSSRLQGADGRSPTTAAVRQQTAGWVRRLVRRSMVLQIARLRVLTFTGRFTAPPGLERPLAVYLPTPPPEVARGLTATRECVSRIAERAAASGARTGVVLLPARLQVSDEDFANLQQAAREGGTTILRNAGTERFKAALAGVPFPVMDALPPLLAAPNRSDLFFRDTAHLTPRGHQVLADALESFLLESRLVPPREAPGARGTGH